MPDDRPTILIVDDETINRDCLSYIFKDAYNVLIASDGKQALDLLKNHRIDLVISDVHMSEITGLDVLQIST